MSNIYYLLHTITVGKGVTKRIKFSIRKKNCMTSRCYNFSH